MDTSDTVKLMLNCHKLIKKHDWLTDSFVIDFFSQNIWETKVPPSWKEALETAKPSDLANLLDYENQVTYYQTKKLDHFTRKIFFFNSFITH